MAKFVQFIASEDWLFRLRRNVCCLGLIGIERLDCRGKKIILLSIKQISPSSGTFQVTGDTQMAMVQNLLYNEERT